MDGTGSMIRVILILISISGCGNLPIAYIQNFSEVNSVIFGFPDYEITQDTYDSYENSFMKIRFGRGPHAILILAYIKDDVYEWIGSDDVRIFTLNGKIIRTQGLPHNFEFKNFSNIDPTSPKTVYSLVDLYNPDMYSAKMESQLFKMDLKSIKKIGTSIDVNQIHESFSISSIGWSDKNIYYQNTRTLEIEAVEQNIHPRLPTAKVEYYFKY